MDIVKRRQGWAKEVVWMLVVPKKKIRRRERGENSGLTLANLGTQNSDGIVNGECSLRGWKLLFSE